ncbi:MarR family winged helix-turn-helix transcriptional regulator [Embleya sp. NPDC050493]|uniref:MarR family winged helix-turn-helix transcriptional regulator n=1 Tax=Embleya sp. NPDC050493 TaxID=3363989 RepID=UPI0037B071A4
MRESDETEGNDPGVEVFHLLRAVTVEYGRRQMEFAERNGMHPTDLRTLICLLDAERAGVRATPGWVGARTGLNSAGTTSAIDRLERLGHVTRERDPEDRRRVLLRVSPQAMRLGRTAFGPLIDEATRILREEFSAEEVATVRRYLERMRHTMTAPDHLVD